VRTRSPVGVLAYVAYSGVDLANFFGLGNETVRDPALASRDFYRVPEHHLVVRPLATATLPGRVRAWAGPAFEYFSNEADRPTAAAGTYGSGKMALASGELSLALDTRTGALTERRGFAADVSVRHYPALLDNAAAFTKLRAEAAALLGSEGDSPVLMGLRVAGEKNWGRYPFFSPRGERCRRWTRRRRWCP
jgi:hypothetical protein